MRLHINRSALLLVIIAFLICRICVLGSLNHGTVNETNAVCSFAFFWIMGRAESRALLRLKPNAPTLSDEHNWEIRHCQRTWTDWTPVKSVYSALHPRLKQERQSSRKKPNRNIFKLIFHAIDLQFVVSSSSLHLMTDCFCWNYINRHINCHCCTKHVQNDRNTAHIVLAQSYRLNHPSLSRV